MKDTPDDIDPRKFIKRFTRVVIGFAVGILIFLLDIFSRIDVNPDPTIDIHGIFLFFGYLFLWVTVFMGLLFLRNYLKGNKNSFGASVICNASLIGYIVFLIVVIGPPKSLSTFPTGLFIEVALLVGSAFVVLGFSLLPIVKRIHQESKQRDEF